MVYKVPCERTIKETFTMMITENCNLRCKYCYIPEKVSKVMSIEVAKTSIDFINEYSNMKDKEIVIEFIGGEPLLEIELLEEITPYIYRKLNNRKVTVFMTTNGTLFEFERVRNYLSNMGGRKSVCLSIDGVKEIHDYNRSNSFDSVIKWYPWWRKNFPNSLTKATLNHESLPYLYDSVKFLMELGLPYVYMNTVLEDVWDEGDPSIYYDQLIKSADYMIDSGLYTKHFVSLFDEHLTRRPEHSKFWCGCGRFMTSVDTEGNLYACTRMKGKPPIGDIYNGIDNNLLLPYFLPSPYSSKCDTCEVSNGCAHCMGNNFDSNGNIYNRATYTCNMHKARVRANQYFFDKIKNHD